MNKCLPKYEAQIVIRGSELKEILNKQPYRYIAKNRAIISCYRLTEFHGFAIRMDDAMLRPRENIKCFAFRDNDLNQKIEINILDANYDGTIVPTEKISSYVKKCMGWN